MHHSSLQPFLNYTLFPLASRHLGAGNPLRTGTYQVLGGIHSGEDSTLSLNRGSSRVGDCSPALNVRTAQTDQQLPLHWQSLS